MECDSGMIEVRIRPMKELFFNEADSYGIYSAEVHSDDLENDVEVNGHGNISIKGVMPKLNMGEEYIVQIVEDKNGKYKGSYSLESIKKEKPITIADQKSFLETILTKNQIDNIFKVYSDGQDIVGMIETGEFEYSKVHGLGEKSFEKLRQKVLDNMDMSEVLAFCGKYGIKYPMIAKLVKQYKNPSIVIDKITMNPYILTEVKGVGFKKADEIAKAVGYSMTSPHRIDSALRHVITEENMNGHSYIGRKQLLNRAIDLLNITKGLIDERLDGEVDNILNVDDERFTKQNVYDSESYIAQRMTAFKTTSKKLFKTDELDKFLEDYCEKNDVELEEHQYQFFHDWNENNILFLVGGGGMGKSWLQRILLALIDKKNYRTALLAPTGKASKVMAGYTGRMASTIHRKAGIFDEDMDMVSLISEDIIIVDESSMCDIFILAKLFKAIENPNARILFVGDDFQLPSVGVGNFLYDVIHSECIKVSVLKKVFRQAEGGILDVATKVRNGESFLNDHAEGRMVFGRDCVFWLTDQAYVKDGVLKNYAKVIERFSQDEVVILTPTNKGALGTVLLNKEIQKIANPPSALKKEKAVGAKGYETIFRVGDTVMNTVNSYKVETVGGGTADIFNGDGGKIIDIDEDDKSFVIDFEGVVVKVAFGVILSSVMHSWVTTIHKSQGSQYKVVIIIIDKSSKFQLNANLLYTGLSRAKEFMLVLGQAETINYAIKKFANMERRSFLQELLHAFNKDTSEVVLGYVEETTETLEEVVEEKPDIDPFDIVFETMSIEEVEEENYYM